MKQKSLIILIVMIVSGLMACASNDETIDYENSVVTPSLEIPPDLITRSKLGKQTDSSTN